MEQFFTGIFSRLSEAFNPTVIGESLAYILTNLTVGVLTFLAFYLLWFLLNKLAALVLKKTNLDKTTQAFANTALKYAVLIIGAIQALAAIGINTASLIASLGIAGLTIGFAARDALSNLISGLLILWDRPFVIGDLVEVDGQYGQVERITLRSTRVVTVDGKMLAVPNTSIVNTTVTSYTNYPNLRVNIDVAVAVSENIERVRKIILDLVKDDPEYLDDPAPRVVVTALNDYNVALQFQVWLDHERDHVIRRFELREKIFTSLTEAGIHMPYETIELAPVEVKAKIQEGSRLN
jgi:small conductance mechanosensitive channel